MKPLLLVVWLALGALAVPSPLRAAKSDGTVSSAPNQILITVKKWGWNVYAGRSSAPSANPAGTELGIFTLHGKNHDANQGEVQFVVRVFPNGTRLPKAEFIAAQKKVQMAINESQAMALQTLLRDSAAVHALYRVDGGVVHADVHGEFEKK
jgi:hypothetical protein